MFTIIGFTIIGLIFAILIPKLWCKNDTIWENLPIMFIGMFIGLMITLALPANLETIKTNVNIIPLNEKYSIGCDKDHYYVQIEDATGFHMEKYDAEDVTIVYNSFCKAHVYRNHKMKTIWNDFAIDTDDNDVTKVIIEVPENSIVLYHLVENE